MDITDNIKTLNCFKNNTDVLKCIYNNDTKTINKISAFINNAIGIYNSNDCSKIEELYYASNNLLNSFFTIKNSIANHNILTNDINNFDCALLDFQYLYKKFNDPTYTTVLNKNKIITRLLHMIIYSHNNSANIIDSIKKELDDMYNINNDATVQFIAAKSQYFIQSKNNLFEYSWSYINKYYKINQPNTIFILLIELRKYCIENIDDVIIKKYIYFNIDVEDINKSIHSNNIYSPVITNAINYFISYAKLEFIKSSNLIDQFFELYKYYYKQKPSTDVKQLSSTK